jgi:hypothetical protein
LHKVFREEAHHSQSDVGGFCRVGQAKELWQSIRLFPERTGEMIWVPSVEVISDRDITWRKIQHRFVRISWLAGKFWDAKYCIKFLS